MFRSLSFFTILVFYFVAKACCDDPEVYMNATSLIVYNGFPAENHYVETKDGFILNIQRIPHGRFATKATKGVVVVQHGLTGASDDFLINLIPGSLGFVLADAGYDVWLSNSRGNVYSMTHKKYNPSQDEFWDWSWQEMAEYDLPAVIHYVLNTTNATTVYYIGHSQGTMIANAQFSVDKDLASKIKLFISMAPIAKVTHVKGLLGFINPYVTQKEAELVLGKKAFDQNSTLTKWYADTFCTFLPAQYICNGLSSIVMGWDRTNLNWTRIPVFTAHSNEGASAKDIIHFLQGIKADKFQKYDYGPDGNMKRYNQTTPPEYHPQNMAVPVAMFYGDNDFLADRTDVQYLLDNLPNIVYQRELPNWNHVDFIIGKDAHQLLYTDILNLMSKYQ
ncbi:lysosomal acid lipase/cholesteryl ester hydrolase-like [Crassostrea angulata]|uniref:lysosomal acid lipase/cholesteryl ester hydrolase-like n=1 Tax=Magallana angulata TaxID=2784310 RepID=UPI0022B119C8|nr:lysosomal acid lipase/cholesteryl ester hydrolase-like [Crassostrea angulata]